MFRDELGFGDGLVLSDCNDLGVLVDYGIASDRTQAAAKGLVGGVGQVKLDVGYLIFM